MFFLVMRQAGFTKEKFGELKQAQANLDRLAIAE
ncbi:hypothetical protein L1274_004142 [Duganella sp. HSC-15S17]|uniref:Uncharacterized protein n=1 Tax=Duganella violaceipulchra TaxID=2849652 RepID=A0ABT1GN52_9BURK|nr:hypothetical protein [Duganella violaceicalia]